MTKSQEDKLNTLHLKRNAVKANIEREKKARKNPFFGTIRLIHARESTRKRLSNFLKRKKEVKKKNFS